MTVKTGISVNVDFTDTISNAVTLKSSLVVLGQPTYFKSWTDRIALPSGTQIFNMDALPKTGLANIDLKTTQKQQYISAINHSTEATSSGTLAFKNGTDVLISFALGPGSVALMQTEADVNLLGQTIDTFELTALTGAIDVEIILATRDAS